ncbi:MAG: hypothetical protein WBX11_05835 [Thiobacillaceae bacterium]
MDIRHVILSQPDITSLAKTPGFTATAEGIETLEPAGLRHVLDCGTLQGCCISKPLPPGYLAASLAQCMTVDKPHGPGPQE